MAYVIEYVIEPETACDVACCTVGLDRDGECPFGEKHCHCHYMREF